MNIVLRKQTQYRWKTTEGSWPLYQSIGGFLPPGTLIRVSDTRDGVPVGVPIGVRTAAEFTAVCTIGGDVNGEELPLVVARVFVLCLVLPPVAEGS